MSSQPFLALDRNLIAIMKYYICSSVKNHCFCFWTKLWQLPPIWINFTQASQQFFTLWLFITHYYLSAQWLPSLWRTRPAESNVQTDRQTAFAPKHLQSRVQNMLCVAARGAPPPTHPAPKGDIKAKGDGTTLPVTSALFLIHSVYVEHQSSPFTPAPNSEASGEVRQTSLASITYFTGSRISTSTCA